LDPSSFNFYLDLDILTPTNPADLTPEAQEICETMDPHSGQNLSIAPETPVPTAIFSLPYELRFQIITFLQPLDILNLLCTSKTLYAHIRDEPIWRYLSLKHGVKNLTDFPGRSFFVVYTRLLHTFGGLIGLWASDYPFRGNVLEFRVVSAKEGWQGIVGEVWRFPRPGDDEEDMDAIRLPHYYQCLRISLEDYDSSESSDLQVSKSPGSECYTKLTRLDWGELPDRFTMVSVGLRTPFYDTHLKLLSPTRQSMFLHFSPLGHLLNETTPTLSEHPDFPQNLSSETTPNLYSAWYDQSRSPPRIRETPSSSKDNTSLTQSPIYRRTMFLFVATSQAEKPAAITLPYTRFHLPNSLSLHAPPMWIPDLRHVDSPQDFHTGEIIPTRYYPLRFPQHFLHEGVNIDFEEEVVSNWEVKQLEGIWLGAYSIHGTEVLYLHLEEEENQLIASKITGDENVPRGVASWWFDTSVQYTPTEAITPSDRFGDIPRFSKVFKGSANVSGEGFSPGVREVTPAIVVVIGKDDIKIRWQRLHHTSCYKRYLGRDVEKEVVSLGGALHKSAVE